MDSGKLLVKAENSYRQLEGGGCLLHGGGVTEKARLWEVGREKTDLVNS